MEARGIAFLGEVAIVGPMEPTKHRSLADLQGASAADFRQRLEQKIARLDSQRNKPRFETRGNDTI
jgi:hypothetical protein